MHFHTRFESWAVTGCRQRLALYTDLGSVFFTGRNCRHWRPTAAEACHRQALSRRAIKQPTIYSSWTQATLLQCVFEWQAVTSSSLCLRPLSSLLCMNFRPLGWGGDCRDHGGMLQATLLCSAKIQPADVLVLNASFLLTSSFKGPIL